MKLHRCTAPSALVFALSAAPAMAAPIFSDDFNRAVGNSVGQGWSETEHNVSDVALVVRSGADHEMQVQDDDPDGIASQLSGISTLGYTGITLTYEWAATNNTESGDWLYVEWRDGALPANAWTQLAAHALNGSTAHQSASWSIPGAEGLTDFEFRYRVAVNANNEGATIDNVVLSAERAPADANAVPEPASLALAGLGLCLLPWAARRRKEG
jgi:hypothetical protein